MYRFFILVAAFAALNVVSADPGDDILKKLTLPVAPPLAPADALKSFKIAPGYCIEIAAHEPGVQDPVALSFDADGRMFVCEMRGYMPDVNATGETKPVGRVVVLESTKNDGIYDRSTVFLDGLVTPRAVLCYDGGVLIGENGKLWFCRSTKGDLKCDDKKLVGDYPVGGNPEYGSNSLTYGLDNWIYSAHSGTRWKKAKGEWIRESTISRGQWGLSQDDVGRLYYNSNSSLLRGDLAPCYAPAAHAASSLTNVGLYNEQDVYPARITPGINRFFNLRPDLTLKSVTAACGPCIYRGDLFAEAKGNAFVCEPSANLVRRNVFFTDKGKLSSKNAYDKAEFLASTDERFRPVNAYTGPDGALYVVDMYRGILQHKTYMTPFLKKQVLDRELDKGINLGRIYRILPEKEDARPIAKLSTASTAELIALLEAGNGWTRDTAQRLLVERNDAKAVSHLQSLFETSKNSLARLHALWTLDGMSRLDSEVLAMAVGDADVHVRSSAVGLCRKVLRNPPDPDLLNALAARANDPSRDVRAQLVATLALIKSPVAEKTLDPILQAAGSDTALLDHVLAGFVGRETEFLAARLDEPAWKTKEPWREKLLVSASTSLAKQKHPITFLRLFHLAGTKREAWQQRAMLKGMMTLTAGKGLARPIKLPAASEGLDALLHSSDMNVKSTAETLAKNFDWPGKDGKPIPQPPKLSAEHQALNDLGRKEYQSLCANCHHPLGYGIAGSGPLLVDSDWLRDSEDRLIRMVLQGVRDPIKINNEVYNRDGSQSMPAMAMALDDQKIAGILTYVRREWGEFAKPVDPATVTRIRAATKDRAEPWTESELLKIK